MLVSVVWFFSRCVCNSCFFIRVVDDVGDQCPSVIMHSPIVYALMYLSKFRAVNVLF